VVFDELEGLIFPERKSKPRPFQGLEESATRIDAAIQRLLKTQNAVILSEAKNLSLFFLMLKSKRDSSLRSE